MQNKFINREHQSAHKIFDDRSLKRDYATLLPLLKVGLKVLDVGCGTGAISRDIAERVGPSGSVTAIDNTEKFILSGRESYQDTPNLHLIHSDLFDFQTAERFDLITAARTLQWLSNPLAALQKMKSMLKPGGIVSILDYNHEELEWEPAPPQSMQDFYSAFLKWRADAGMNNRIADDLSGYFGAAGFDQIEVLDANEVYYKSDPSFESRVGIWSKVAKLNQIVEEGYLTEQARLLAIEEYDLWVPNAAEKMVMKLKEVRGVILNKK